MSHVSIRPAAQRDKPAIRPELLEATWEEFCQARERAMKSARVEDGIRAGRAWGSFLRLFETKG